MAASFEDALRRFSLRPEPELDRLWVRLEVLFCLWRLLEPPIVFLEVRGMGLFLLVPKGGWLQPHLPGLRIFPADACMVSWPYWDRPTRPPLVRHFVKHRETHGHLHQPCCSPKPGPPARTKPAADGLHQKV